MDILTLELYDVTVSEALREIHRALEDHPALPLRIFLGSDGMFHHNIVRFLERQGRKPLLRSEKGQWRIETEGGAGHPGALPPTLLPPPPPKAPPPAPTPASLPVSAQAPGRRPILLTRASLSQGSAAVGRRLLLGVLRELDSAPWLCLALEGLELLEDPQALKVLEALQARGTPVRVSRESQFFSAPSCPFEVMEDSHWQRLAGKGELTIL